MTDHSLLPQLLILVAAVSSAVVTAHRLTPEPRYPHTVTSVLDILQRLKIKRLLYHPIWSKAVSWQGSKVIRPETVQDTMKLPTRPLPPNSLSRRRRSQSGGGGRGCQLGTCQLHNLANTLYRIAQHNGKEESQGVSDPRGYGRRRR